MSRLNVVTGFSFASPFRYRSSSAASSASQASTSTAASPVSPNATTNHSHSYNRDSVMSSPAMTINSVVFGHPSIVDLAEERQSFGNELAILEPRPVVYWGGVEERMHMGSK